MLPNICMYSATINPKEIEIKGLSEKFDNDYAIASQKEEIAMQVKNAASQSPAEGGADYFQAIIEAADSLQGAQNPLIVVYGSGLSDHGILNFADDGLLSKADDYAIAQLSQTKIRKNEYRNTEIIWLGAGETINDNGQEPLDADHQKKVEDIYISALGYIGMKPSFGKIQITKDTTSVSNTYHVNPTMIPGKLTKGYTKHLDERVAKFLPGSSTLSNPDEVKRMLMEFAKEFKQTDNSLKLKITGYHAKCTGGSDKEFSKRRAAAIGDILIKELNIDASRIIVDGVGGPQDDREEVTCDSEIAKEHRVVIMEVVEQ
jgi:outer membrane protein OmpA-like peptidoglycan-associated protein